MIQRDAKFNFSRNINKKVCLNYLNHFSLKWTIISFSIFSTFLYIFVYLLQMPLYVWIIFIKNVDLDLNLLYMILSLSNNNDRILREITVTLMDLYSSTHQKLSKIYFKLIKLFPISVSPPNIIYNVSSNSVYYFSPRWYIKGLLKRAV